MRGAILPLPQYAFMAWCSVKAQRQILVSDIHIFVITLFSTIPVSMFLPERIQVSREYKINSFEG
jgi:hypothetical protein